MIRWERQEDGGWQGFSGCFGSQLIVGRASSSARQLRTSRSACALRPLYAGTGLRRDRLVLAGRDFNDLPLGVI
jgi:hypothetical protein